MRLLALLAILVVSAATTTPADAAHGWHAAFVDQSPWPKLAPGATASYTIRFRSTAIQSEATVAPGAVATFTFGVRAPETPGLYRLHLRPVIDGNTWLEDYCAPRATRD